MAGILKVDQIAEANSGQGVRLNHALKNSSGTEIMSAAGSLSSSVQLPMFVGMIAAFAMPSAPSGWLVCNGADYETADYTDLHTVITSTWVTAWTNGESITTGDFRKNSSGTIYIATSTGTTSGTDVGDDTGVAWSTTTKFLVPDLRGEFLRGFDNGNGNDPDAASRTGGDAVGSSQSDAIRNITGSYRDTSSPARGLYNKSFSGAFQSAGTTPRITNYVTGISGDDLAFDASNVVPTGSDNRPRNKYVQYCIKY